MMLHPYSKFVHDLHEKIGTTGLALTSAATLIVGVVYAYHLNLSLKRTGEAPVHWSWLPVLGNAIDMGSHPLEFLSECAAEHEDIFGMVVAGNRMFIISDVFSSNLILKPPKSFSWEEFHDLVLSNFFGAQWGSSGHHGVNSFDEQLMRNWYSKYLLSDSALGKLTIRMQVQLARDTDRLTAAGTAAVPFYDLLSRLIFQASVAALLTPEAADDPALFEAFKVFDQHLPLAAGGFKVSYAQAPREARELLYRAVRKYESADNCDFIKKRFEYFDSFGNPHNTVAFQLAMVWASVGNTMPSVFWLVFFLMRNPAAMQAVLEEIQSIRPPADSSGGSSGGCSADFTQEELNRMTYMDACITETLRLCSGSLIMRHVKEPCEVTLASGKSYRFRQGDRVGLCPPLWHRDAELYPQPSAFNPARWLPAEATTPEELAVASQGKVQLYKAGKPLPLGAGYMPFGGGVTFCPGRRFARNEVKTLVAVLLVNFRFEFAGSDAQPDFDGARAGLGIFPPKTDVLVRVTRKA